MDDVTQSLYAIPGKLLHELLTLCGPEDHELRERIRAALAAAPQGPAPGMAVTALAGEIIAALEADEKDGGYDLTSGLFGPKFSALVRRWAASEWAHVTAPQAPAAPVVNHSVTWTSADDGLPEHGDLVLCDFGPDYEGGGIQFGYEVLTWDEHHTVAGVARWLKLDRMPESLADHTEIDRLMAAPAVPEDPMDWPLPCDVTVGHGTIRKGCKLRILVLRMQVLYDLSRKVELAAPAAPSVYSDDMLAALHQWRQRCEVMGAPHLLPDSHLLDLEEAGLLRKVRGGHVMTTAGRDALAAPAAPSGRYKLADDGAHQYLDGIEARYSIEREDGTTVAWVLGNEADAKELMAAIGAAPEAAPAAPSGLPHGWVPCILTHDGQHPEEVAYGPQIMMDRLKKWLGRYFELLAQKVLAEPVHAEMLAALQAVAMDVVHVGAGENAISDAARAKVEAVLEKIGAPWPSPVAAPAAPAVDAELLELAQAIVKYKWTRDGFFDSDIQDAPWRGLAAQAAAKGEHDAAN